MRYGVSKPLRGALLLITAVLLASCASDPDPVAVPEQQDGPSTRPLTAAEIKDAVPRSEPRARYGNHSPYEVFGKKYKVLASSEGYVERGTASWYGSKFHGRRTSSGEPYDMHLATAAHKTLPLPTYAEVTNLNNGKKVIVKINDRGPFKDNRILDLSYGAALRLDVIGNGTAPVEVRAITSGFERFAGNTARVNEAIAFESSDIPPDGAWLQAGAYGQRAGAEALVARLEKARLTPVSIKDGGGLYRVWLGPFFSNTDINSAIERAIELGFERPHTVKR